MIRATVSFAALLSLAAGLAWADSHEAAGEAGEATMEEMGHGDHGAMAPDDAAGAMTSFHAVMTASMDSMAMESTGDADADFLLMMISHHQSAVDMARIVLEVGDEPEVQALAQQIIDSQEAEIVMMQEMLAGMGIEAGMDDAPSAEAAGTKDAAPAEGEASSN